VPNRDTCLLCGWLLFIETPLVFICMSCLTLRFVVCPLIVSVFSRRNVFCCSMEFFIVDDIVYHFVDCVANCSDNHATTF